MEEIEINLNDGSSNYFESERYSKRWQIPITPILNDPEAFLMKL